MFNTYQHASIYESRITSAQLHYQAIGQTVFVVGMFNLPNAASANSALATGFPTPNWSIGAIISGYKGGTDNTSQSFYINVSGSLCVSGDKAAAAGWYSFSGFYYSA